MGLRKHALLLSLVLSFATVAAVADDAKPRTGYFTVSTTTQELLGESGAAALAEIFDAGESLEWQLSVPANYDPDKPAGVIVFVNNWSKGGGRKSYVPVFEDKNLIWIGPINAGEGVSLDKRYMKAMLAATIIRQDYAVDTNRIYVGGFSSGAYVAAMLATSKPELFKGAMFAGGALFWEDKTPPGIDLLRQNRYVFIAGQNDLALDTVKRTAQAYRAAGITNTKVLVMKNRRQEMPGEGYFAQAIDYLDGVEASE